jgi:septum formation protein
MARPPIELVLASSSPSRRRILDSAGIGFEIDVSGVEETWGANDDPAASVAVLARRKASAVAQRRPDRFVLGCDSLFAFGGRTLGKPGTEEEAAARWRAMGGSSGVLYTGHALVYRGEVAEEVVATAVHFSRPTEGELTAYVASGEPIAVAGGFTLEGRSAAFIDRVEGDPSNVVGLSVAALRRLLGTFGVSIAELWR